MNALTTRALALPALASPHTRADLMRYDYRAGALRACLRNLASPPAGMGHIMQRSALDLLAEIDAVEAMMREAA